MAAAVNQSRPLKVDAPLAWLLPLRCLVCGQRGHDGMDLCAACLDAMPWMPPACTRCALPLGDGDGDVGDVCGPCLRQRDPPIRRAHAALLYGFPLDRLLPRLKFHADFAAGRVLARLMAQGLRDAERPEALVPVPLHARRLRRRGYDQTLELARPLAHRLGIPIRTDLLTRRRATQAQSRLDEAQRQHNLHGAFAVGDGSRPAHVALIDDVMTTGATLRAAAQALRAAGVARVDAWVCARVP